MASMGESDNVVEPATEPAPPTDDGGVPPTMQGISQNHPPQSMPQQPPNFHPFGMGWSHGPSGMMLQQPMHSYPMPHGVMDLTLGMPALLLGASMDPLEAVLGPFPCVCLRGLPFEASLEDVLCFFQGLVVLDVVVTGSVPIDGHAGGEAFVVFANPMDFQMALQRDRQSMGGRYIEVFRGKRSEYYTAIAEQHWHQQAQVNNTEQQAIGELGNPVQLAPGGAWGNINQAPKGKSQGGAGPAATRGPYASQRGKGTGASQAGRGAGRGSGAASSGRGGNAGRGGGIQEGEHTGYIRMRGLPFTTTSKEIANFFKEYDPIESSITLTCRSDGRATGEGYVAFKSPEDAQTAMALHRSSMGSRYIELFISNEEEHTRSLSRSMGR